MSADISFTDVNGNPLIGSGPVNWTIFDYNNNNIMTGVAQQNLSNAALWSAEFVLPQSCPLTNNGKRYSLVWNLPQLNSPGATGIERFQVIAANNPLQPGDKTDIIFFERQPFSDHLLTKEEIAGSSLHYTIHDAEGQKLYDGGLISANTGQIIEEDLIDYQITIDPERCDGLSAIRMGFTPYIGMWKYETIAGDINSELHMLYAINFKISVLIHKLRQSVDRAVMADINKYLAYTDVDMIAFLIRGLDRVNLAPPWISYYALGMLPAECQDIVIKCAAIELLRAQLLAEGISNAFEFSGAGVQLNVDRTALYENLINQWSNEVDANLKSIKRLLIRRSGPGILGVTIGRYCLVGDTWIATEKGGIQILDLYNSFTKGIQIPKIWSYDFENKEFGLKEANLVQLTTHTKDLVKVVFNSREEFVCTPTHPFLLTSLNYVEAAKLFKGANVFGEKEFVVDRIETLNLENEIPVYDIKMKENPNFAISYEETGYKLIVHNTNLVSMGNPWSWNRSGWTLPFPFSYSLAVMLSFGITSLVANSFLQNLT